MLPTKFTNNGVSLTAFGGEISVTVALFDVLPCASSTLYCTGVGVPVNPANGVNVIAPVVGFTVHVPSPAMVMLVTSPLASVTMLVAPVGTTKLTVVGTTVSPVVSLASTFIVADVPGV